MNANIALEQLEHVLSRLRRRHASDELAGAPERVGDARASVDRTMRARHHLERQRLRRGDVIGESPGVGPLEPGRVQQVEEDERLVVHVRRHVVGVVHRAGEAGAEGVDAPEHTGAGVEEAARGGGVEHRWAHDHQIPVADVDRVAHVRPAHALQWELDVGHQSRDRRVVRQERRVGAPFEDDLEVAEVVVVVVREEDPADVLRLDEREHVLQPAVATEEHAGVDDHRFGAPDDQAVGAEVAAGRIGAQGGDEPRVGGDGLGLGG